MESLFSLLQKRVLDRWPWATSQVLRIAIMTWTERTYHRRRMQVSLGRLTRPIRKRRNHTGPPHRVTKPGMSPDLHQT